MHPQPPVPLIEAQEGAKLAAERPYYGVILSPFAVILSAAKNLPLPLRVNSAKDFALSIFRAMRDSSSPLLLRRQRLWVFPQALTLISQHGSGRAGL
jgi:hypothetical protein